MKNNTLKYFKYAIGEIALVMIGILLALQVNNWNENKRSQIFQTKILKEMKISMEQDLKRTEYILKYRAEVKRKAINDFIANLQSSETAAKKLMKRNFVNTGITLSFFYDKGPYESLKANGLDKINNDSLRKTIIRFYEVTLPLSIVFIDWDEENHSLKRDELRDKLTYNSFQKKDTLWRVTKNLDFKKLKDNPDLKKLLFLEQNVAINYISRLEYIIDNYKIVLKAINNELK